MGPSPTLIKHHKLPDKMSPDLLFKTDVKCNMPIWQVTCNKNELTQLAKLGASLRVLNAVKLSNTHKNLRLHVRVRRLFVKRVQGAHAANILTLHWTAPLRQMPWWPYGPHTWTTGLCESVWSRCSDPTLLCHCGWPQQKGSICNTAINN